MLRPSIRSQLHTIIFESETIAGKAFDLTLLTIIVASILTIMLESVASIRNDYGFILTVLEWIFTGLFTLEYILRLYAVQKPLRFALSFYGIIDLVSFIPTYLTLLLPGAQYLMAVRVFRLLRIFRILKLNHFVSSGITIMDALKRSRHKISIFLFSVMNVVIIMGAVMYLIEGEENGFTSIPRSIYWAVVTLTTVGYGDIAPKTPLGQIVAVMIMILGYGIIAVPTGIVTSEMVSAPKKDIYLESCPQCGREGHDRDARYCKHCGAPLHGNGY